MITQITTGFLTICTIGYILTVLDTNPPFGLFLGGTLLTLIVGVTIKAAQK